MDNEILRQFYGMSPSGRVPGTNLPYFGGTFKQVIDVVGEEVSKITDPVIDLEGTTGEFCSDDGFSDYRFGSTYIPASTTKHLPSNFDSEV